MTKTTTELAELLPCPFCGGDNLAEGLILLPPGKWVNEIECLTCNATGGHWPLPAEAITAWNTRTPSPSSIRREADVERVASAIHDARFGPDWPEGRTKDTLATTDRSGREYCYRLARAAIRALSPEPVDQWRPIASAPGGEWLLVFEDSGNPDIRGDYYAACFIGEPDDGYWIAACGQYVTSSPEPTHWMPLPAPPETVDAPVKGEGK